MSALEVRLSWSEVYTAAQFGVRRQVLNLSKGRRHRYGGESRDPWGMHVRGCLGELAVAKALGRYWDPVRDRVHAGDVGSLEIRHTDHLTGRLLLHPEDGDDAAYILVCGEPPVLRIPGWIFGRDGKRDEYLSQPDPSRAPAYWVPQSALRPLETLEAAA